MHIVSKASDKRRGELATTLAVLTMGAMLMGALIGVANPNTLRSLATRRLPTQYPNVLIREDGRPGLPHVLKDAQGHPIIDVRQENGQTFTYFDIEGQFCFAQPLYTGSELWTFWASSDLAGKKPISLSPHTQGKFDAGAAYPAPCRRTQFNVGDDHPKGRLANAVPPPNAGRFVLTIKIPGELTADNPICSGDGVILNYDSNRHGKVEHIWHFYPRDEGMCGGPTPTPTATPTCAPGVSCPTATPTPTPTTCGGPGCPTATPTPTATAVPTATATPTPTNACPVRDITIEGRIELDGELPTIPGTTQKYRLKVGACQVYVGDTVLCSGSGGTTYGSDFVQDNLSYSFTIPARYYNTQIGLFLFPEYYDRTPSGGTPVAWTRETTEALRCTDIPPAITKHYSADRLRLGKKEICIAVVENQLPACVNRLPQDFKFTVPPIGANGKLEVFACPVRGEPDFTQVVHCKTDARGTRCTGTRTAPPGSPEGIWLESQVPDINGLIKYTYGYSIIRNSYAEPLQPGDRIELRDAYAWYGASFKNAEPPKPRSVVIPASEDWQVWWDRDCRAPTPTFTPTPTGLSCPNNLGIIHGQLIVNGSLPAICNATPGGCWFHVNACDKEIGPTGEEGVKCGPASGIPPTGRTYRDAYVQANQPFRLVDLPDDRDIGVVANRALYRRDPVTGNFTFIQTLPSDIRRALSCSAPGEPVSPHKHLGARNHDCIVKPLSGIRPDCETGVDLEFNFAQQPTVTPTATNTPTPTVSITPTATNTPTPTGPSCPNDEGVIRGSVEMVGLTPECRTAETSGRGCNLHVFLCPLNAAGTDVDCGPGGSRVLATAIANGPIAAPAPGWPRWNFQFNNAPADREIGIRLDRAYYDDTGGLIQFIHNGATWNRFDTFFIVESRFCSGAGKRAPAGLPPITAQYSNSCILRIPTTGQNRCEMTHNFRLEVPAEPSPTLTPTATATPSPTASATPTATATATPTPSASASPTATPSPTRPISCTFDAVQKVWYQDAAGNFSLFDASDTVNADWGTSNSRQGFGSPYNIYRPNGPRPAPGGAGKTQLIFSTGSLAASTAGIYDVKMFYPSGQSRYYIAGVYCRDLPGRPTICPAGMAQTKETARANANPAGADIINGFNIQCNGFAEEYGWVLKERSQSCPLVENQCKPTIENFAPTEDNSGTSSTRVFVDWEFPPASCRHDQIKVQIREASLTGQIIGEKIVTSINDTDTTVRLNKDMIDGITYYAIVTFVDTTTPQCENSNTSSFVFTKVIPTPTLPDDVKTRQIDWMVEGNSKAACWAAWFDGDACTGLNYNGSNKFGQFKDNNKVIDERVLCRSPWHQYRDYPGFGDFTSQIKNITNSDLKARPMRVDCRSCRAITETGGRRIAQCNPDDSDATTTLGSEITLKPGICYGVGDDLQVKEVPCGTGGGGGGNASIKGTITIDGKENLPNNRRIKIQACDVTKTSDGNVFDCNSTQQFIETEDFKNDDDGTLTYELNNVTAGTRGVRVFAEYFDDDGQAKGTMSKNIRPQDCPNDRREKDTPENPGGCVMEVPSSGAVTMNYEITVNPSSSLFEILTAPFRALLNLLQGIFIRR